MNACIARRFFDVEFASIRAIIVSAYGVALHVKVSEHASIYKISHNISVEYKMSLHDPQLLATPIVRNELYSSIRATASVTSAYSRSARPWTCCLTLPGAV
jgi:hypothetical protein